MTATSDARQPLLSIVRGAPTVEQVAALVAVVTARAAAAADEAAAPVRPLWSEPVLRNPVAAGPGAWRASGLPQG